MRRTRTRADLLDEAKVGILAGSLLSGIVGALLLRFTRGIDTLERTEPGLARAADG